jgi:hypothetical protein
MLGGIPSRHLAVFVIQKSLSIYVERQQRARKDWTAVVVVHRPCQVVFLDANLLHTPTHSNGE